MMDIDQVPAPGPMRLCHDTGASFPALPEELIKLILECACMPSSDAARHTDDDTRKTENEQQAWSDRMPGALIDVDTTRAIALVSQAAHTLVMPLLYGSVSLKKPSQLIKLAETLIRRPVLGLYVRNLWVGNLHPPSNLLPPFVFRDPTFAQSARAHLERQGESSHAGATNTGTNGAAALQQNDDANTSHRPSCPDFIYLERGCDYAAMNVIGPHTRIVEARKRSAVPHASTLKDLLDDDELADSDSEAGELESGSNSTAMLQVRPGFGVDKAWGYDSIGTWIGCDKWVLRCIELQYALEFHYEWVTITALSRDANTNTAMSNDLREQDLAARRSDPLDWADAVTYPLPLPSEIARRDREQSHSSSSTTADQKSNISKFGLKHIDRFFALRRRGFSPRIAARILLERQLLKQRGTTQGPSLEELCSVGLLSDESELDDFLSPALFARSGATHLIVNTIAPLGDHAPPDAVPAQVITALNGAPNRAQRRWGLHRDGEEGDRSSTGDSDSDNGMHRGAGQHRARRGAYDLVDVFGHVDHQSRTLQLRPTSGERAGPSHQAEHSIDSTSQGHEVDDRYARTLRPSRDEGVWSHFRQDEHARTFSQGRTTNVQADPPQTLGSLVAKLRAILALCPSIRVLALNGFLERAVAGSRGCAMLPRLRHLSLGPPPPYWSSPLDFDQSVLTSLHSLHVSGCMLYRSEVMDIGGYDSSILPRLREFNWTLWTEHAADHPISVVSALGGLLGSELAVSTRSATAMTRRGGEGQTRVRMLNNTRQASLTCERPLRRVRVHLHEGDLANWRQHAPEALRQDPRLHLSACSPEIQSNFHAVRGWWERKAGL